MKKVLLVTDVDFWELCSGHRVRIAALVKFLSANIKLSVVFTGPANSNEEVILANLYNAKLTILEKKKRLDSNGYTRKLKAFLKINTFDTIIIEYIHCSYFLNSLIADCQVILDTHDIINERSAGFQKFNYSHTSYTLSEAEEAIIYNIYDNIIMICKPDFEKACKMVESDKLLLCPHPLETMEQELNAEVKSISFIASAYLPNIDSITHFIENCWESISAKYNVELNIYGTVCEKLSFKNKQKINIHGYVNDLAQIYKDADIVINPVRFGSGLKIKNLEALAFGKPLVTTTHGARGIESGANESYLLADTTQEFINAITALIENGRLRRKLHKNAYNFIKENFSALACFRPLLNVIENFTNE